MDAVTVPAKIIVQLNVPGMELPIRFQNQVPVMGVENARTKIPVLLTGKWAEELILCQSRSCALAREVAPTKMQVP